LRAVGDLLARDLDRLVIAVLLDQLLELRRPGDVGTLADVDEQQLRRDDQRLEAGESCAAIGHSRSCICRFVPEKRLNTKSRRTRREAKKSVNFSTQERAP